MEFQSANLQQTFLTSQAILQLFISTDLWTIGTFLYVPMRTNVLYLVLYLVGYPCPFLLPCCGGNAYEVTESGAARAEPSSLELCHDTAKFRRNMVSYYEKDYCKKYCVLILVVMETRRR